jgi:putative ABC transport system substrate-binding protein
MHRKNFWLLATILLATVTLAEAQQLAKVFKIGWLVTGSKRPSQPEFLHRELRALGYVEGKNIFIEYRFAEGKQDRYPPLADELVRLKVDVIFTSSIPAARAAKNATRTVPIVFLAEGDPVVAGLVDSLARPGGNITGVTTISPVIAGKRLELLKETVPKLSRIAVLWTRGGSDQTWNESQLAARELGLQLHSMEVSSADKLESAFKAAVTAGSRALAVTPYSLTNSNRNLIADLAAKNRLPAIGPRREFVESGVLMSYGADRDELYRRLAVFVDKILKGTNPSEIPVEQPMKFELAINFKTAKTLNLTIPPIVLMRATKVIK